MAKTSKRKKKQLFMIIGAALVAASVAVMVYLMVFKKDAETGYATATFNNIKSDSKIPEKEYTNLDFSNAVLNIPDAEKFYKLYFTNDEHTPKECASACYEIFHNVFFQFGGESIQFVDSEKNPLKDGEAGLRYLANGSFNEAEIIYYPDSDGEGCYVCRFDADGRFIAYDTQTLVGRDDEQLEELIHLDRGETAPDTKYTVGGEDYSPAQALEFAQNIIMSQGLSKYLPGNSVSPTELVIIKNNQSGEYRYMIQFEYVFEGTPYFHLSLPLQTVSQICPSYGVVYITIASPNRVAEIYNMNSSIATGNDGERDDKYIPLEKAADLVNEYMAPYFKQEISEVTIKYAVVVDEPAEIWDGKEDFVEFLNRQEEKRKERGKLYFNPYWCFIIDKANPVGDDYCLSGKAIFVDMQTGEVIVGIDARK